jgi:SIR2-like protein/AAA domain-containing protein
MCVVIEGRLGSGGASALATEADVFNLYPRAVAHMRSQLEKTRFGVILGAGVGKPLGFPDWQELMGRIATNPRVGATRVLEVLRAANKPLPLQAQVMFSRFRANFPQAELEADVSQAASLRLIRAEWRNLVHQCLYEGVPETTSVDSVYRQFVDVIKQSAMTVNYNFDDTLERLLLDKRSQQEKGYETVTDARLQFQRNAGVIYHPNGFLPRSRFDNPSDSIVLTEDSFGDQLIDSMSGQFAALANHLSKNTCLLIGISLEDQTLRHLLRQHARMNPGHVHYYVRFVGDSVESDAFTAEREANFEVFNLVTLFLDSAGLASLSRLLVMPEVDLTSFAQPSAYCFYLTGAPGTGKTAIASFLKNLITYDEWIEARPDNLAKPHDELSSTERAEVDEWVLRQIGIKNQHLEYDTYLHPVGVRVVDRCLADPIAFSEYGQWAAKAAAIKAAIEEHHRPAHPGHVILLQGDPKELTIRVRAQNKRSSVDYTTRLQRDMKILYGGAQGVTQMNLEGCDLHEAVKRVARLVHMEPYEECDLGAILSGVESGHVHIPA